MEQSPDCHRALEGEKLSWRCPGGSHGRRIRPTFHAPRFISSSDVTVCRLGTIEQAVQLVFAVGPEHFQLIFHYCILLYHGKCSLTLFFCINRVHVLINWIIAWLIT
jgi:hypothetical protein